MAETKIRVLIDVSQTEISNGKPRNPHCCMIALALKKRFPGARNVSATGLGVTLNTEEMLWERYPLSRQAVSFMARFDSDKPVKPFKTRISIPKSEFDKLEANHVL